jgi:hypothetical protein
MQETYFPFHRPGVRGTVIGLHLLWNEPVAFSLHYQRVCERLM